jgi:hypothetical protein
MRPACCVDDSGSADMITRSVAIALEDPLEVTQESFGAFSFTTHAKVEDYRRLWPAVLPKVGLVVFSSAIVHLHIHRGLVCLEYNRPLAALGPSPLRSDLKVHRPAGPTHPELPGTLLSGLPGKLLCPHRIRCQTRQWCLQICVLQRQWRSLYLYISRNRQGLN